MAIDKVLNSFSSRTAPIEPPEVHSLRNAPVRYAGKPNCYVNESGGYIRSWLNSIDSEPESVLVIYDDFSLDIGTMRLRPEGSSGGHRGLQNVIDVLSTEAVPRLRIGIGPLPNGESAEDYVLSTISDTDRDRLDSVLENVPDVLESIRDDDFQDAMNEWNGTELDARR